MSGYRAVLELRRLEEAVDQLGFMLCASKHGGYSNDDFSDRVAIKPKDQTALPIYSRDAEVFSGTLEQLRVWLQGVTWAREYDRILKLSSVEKRAKKEQDYAAKRMLDQLAGEQLEPKIDK
jgi:hypothetical protein